MTVLVGIKCQDGIIIGSDSSATFGPWAGAATIEQPIQKIDIIDNALILAGTGAVGLGQRFCAKLTEVHNDKGEKGYRGRTAIEAMKKMSAAGIQDFIETHVQPRQYGALVAFQTRKELHLCEFSAENMQPELKTEQLWYSSMGNGQSIADPFLALMRKVFWTKGMPSLADGIFAAVWAVQFTIDVNPGGINAPVRIATLTWEDADKKEKPIARFLAEDEVDQHLESVASAEKHLATFSELISGAKKDEVSAPPVPIPAPVPAA